MEAFTLLNYSKPTTEKTTPSSATKHTNDIEPEQDDDPFFDLEFTVPKEEEDDDDDINSVNDSESEFEFTLSPSSTNDQLQFELSSTEPNSKLQFTSSFLKSAAKFRLFMLSLNKSKPNNTLASHKISNQQRKSDSQKKKKLFTVKFKVDEVPFVSFFTKDNYSRGKTGKNNDKASQENNHNIEESQLRFSKEVMQKYLKKVKPLYVKVSRKYAEKLKFSGQLNMPPMKNSTAEKARKEENVTENGGISLKGQKQGTLPLPAGLRIVCKHLGKSRSASSPEETVVSSRRHDDSMMQQQDGIQSAILHCKSSFNASKEFDLLHSVEKSCK